jgi:hypothetical protein
MTVEAVETAAGRLRDLPNERVPDMLIVAAAAVRSRCDRQNHHKRTREVREARMRRPTERSVRGGTEGATLQGEPREQRRAVKKPAIPAAGEQ